MSSLGGNVHPSTAYVDKTTALGSNPWNAADIVLIRCGASLTGTEELNSAINGKEDGVISGRSDGKSPTQTLVKSVASASSSTDSFVKGDPPASAALKCPTLDATVLSALCKSVISRLRAFLKTDATEIDLKKSQVPPDYSTYVLEQRPHCTWRMMDPSRPAPCDRPPTELQEKVDYEEKGYDSSWASTLATCFGRRKQY